MNIIYSPSNKELLNIKNKVVLDIAIPLLLKEGFSRSPFSTAWFGRNNLNDFDYELCRLAANSNLEVVRMYVAREDKWIQISLNIFELDPTPGSITELDNIDGLQFRLPPNSSTEIRLRSDDIKGPPIFRLKYMTGHKLKPFLTRAGLERSIIHLTNILKSDIENFDKFIKRWHELNKPLKTNWMGHQVK